MKNTTRQIIVLSSTLISLFGIYWINAGKTSLKPVSQVAGREEVINYTLPPDFSFGIWSVIYLGFLIYAIYQLIPSQKNNAYLIATGYPVALSILFNLLWTVIVGLEQWFAAYFLQWVMLAVAIQILLRWSIGSSLPLTQKWLSVPFALYAGWLTVAMIPFTSDLLNKSSWNYAPFEPKTWAVILYIIACVIVLAVFRKLRHPFYILPLAWALFGFVTRFDAVLQVTAAALAVILLIVFIMQCVRFYKHDREQIL